VVRLDGIALGAAPPEDVNVVLTAAAGSEPLAVELDEETGALTVSRLFHTAMRYPANVGLIPRTRGEGGGALQATVATSHVLAPGMVIAVRPVGVLYVSGKDAEELTVLAVPAARVSGRYDGIRNYADIPQGQLRQMADFFCHYRDVEERGRPRSSGWGDVNEAHRVISEAAERARRPAGGVD
jgi:inorganic pyrophosphatase